MSGLYKYMLGCAGESFKVPRVRGEFVLLLICVGGWVATRAISSAASGAKASLVGLGIFGSVILFEIGVLIPYRRIRELERRLWELSGSPLELEIPDRDLDAVHGGQCACEVRIVNKGRKPISGVRVELVDVDEPFKSQGITLPHELSEPPAQWPVLRLLGRIDEGTDAPIHPGARMTRVGLANLVVGKALFSQEPGIREDKVFGAFAGTRRLVDMTALAIGREYRFKVRVSARGVPPKESAFLMRVTAQDSPPYRVAFNSCNGTYHGERGCASDTGIQGP